MLMSGSIIFWFQIKKRRRRRDEAASQLALPSTNLMVDDSDLITDDPFINLKVFELKAFFILPVLFQYLPLLWSVIYLVCSVTSTAYLQNIIINVKLCHLRGIALHPNIQRICDNYVGLLYVIYLKCSDVDYYFVVKVQ